MSRFYIVSVGTSLIVNYNKKIEGYSAYNEISTNSLHHNNSWYNKNSREYLYKFISKEANRFDEIASLSAELSSILHWDRGTKLDLSDGILLIATNTPEGSFCAHALKKIIEDKWKIIGSGDRVCTIQIKEDINGLANADDPAFGARGLPSFLKFVVDQIREKKKDHEVILIPTGGYKALIPYMVIAGIIEEVPCRYVYEESKNVLELPPLPLHVDFPRWLQIESVINVLKGKKNYENNNVWKSFDKYLSGILVPEEEGRLVSTGIDDILRERAREVGGEPELVIRAKNSPLLSFIDDEGLRKRFLKLASIGDLIWKGDRVPEMVDHGLRHHNDLFLLAERILLPIFYYRPDFLKGHELFALLCALFLHDCGHVVGCIDLDCGQKRRLLPTDVRDHHHVLGYLRLVEYDRHGKTAREIFEALRGVSDKSGYNEEAILDEYLRSVATIGLYHRKKMKIEEDGFEYGFLGLREKPYLKSLKEHMNGNCLKILDKTIPFERAALLVSLLRIIDGLDEQASRTGSKEDVAFHLSILETEIEEERMRAEEGLEEALRSLLGDDVNSLKNPMRRYLKNYAKSELKDPNNENLHELMHELMKVGEPISSEEFEKEFKQFLEKYKNKKPFIEEYVHSFLRMYFKIFQKGPYEEKQCIKGVKIDHWKDGGNVHLRFDLDTLEEDKPKAKKMLKGISREYLNDENDAKEEGCKNMVVKKYLEKFGVYLHYGEEGDDHGSGNNNR